MQRAAAAAPRAARRRARGPAAGGGNGGDRDRRPLGGRQVDARRRARLALAAPVVALEDLYGGWDGLEEGVARLVASVLEPLAAGRARSCRATTGVRGPGASRGCCEPPPRLIVEGVGAGARGARPVHEPARLARAAAADAQPPLLARDGAASAARRATRQRPGPAPGGGSSSRARATARERGRAPLTG